MHFENLSEDEDEIDLTNDYIDKINHLKSNKKKPNLENFPLQAEALFFREKLIKEISNLKFDFKRNLSDKQIYYLKKFINGKATFKILQCDKNVGSLIISNDDHDKLMRKNLNANNFTYETLEENPLISTITLINNKLEELKTDEHISPKLYKCLKASLFSKLGSPRLLPKLHKTKFDTRLIINCIKHPTESLCSFVDLFLKNIVVNLPPVLKDSQDLLQRLIKNKKRVSQLYLYSCDFESLYTNIKPVDATDRICKYINDNNLIKTKNFDIVGFRSLLELIFTNNIFTFNGLYFLQKVGLPMGCKCGPTIANLYLYTYEINWLNVNNPICYGRFIDDIMVANESPLDIDNFKNNFNYLKLNIETGEKIKFFRFNY